MERKTRRMVKSLILLSGALTLSAGINLNYHLKRESNREKVGSMVDLNGDGITTREEWRIVYEGLGLGNSINNSYGKDLTLKQFRSYRELENCEIGNIHHDYNCRELVLKR